ncbi:MAG TPA: MarR family transcriptional regulator [Chloroflexi bacterium]|nr:MarR family transcriptional regulator [Chloroflexota bacterium]
MIEAQTLYSLVLESYLLLDSSDRDFFQQYGLSSTRYYILVHVAQNAGLSLSELSELLFCTKGNTTRIIKSMEADGYITREVDAHDNRLLCHYLTPAGTALLAEVSTAYNIFNQARFAGLSLSQRGTLQQNLQALNSHLREGLSQD